MTACRALLPHSLELAVFHQVLTSKEAWQLQDLCLMSPEDWVTIPPELQPAARRLQTFKGEWTFQGPPAPTWTLGVTLH